MKTRTYAIYVIYRLLKTIHPATAKRWRQDAYIIADFRFTQHLRNQRGM